VGVDLSFHMLREGLARGVSAPLIQADMRHLPFRRGSFRGIWASASLLHIPKAQAGDALKELARVVHSGHIYVSVKRGEGEAWVPDEQGHRRLFAYYQPAALELLLERSGFEVLTCWQSPDAAGRERPWVSVLARTKH
jgi:ubiquinone/menaquinone biosynthesis C-methylase UbiE